MADSTETFDRNLVRSLYHATEDKAVWWSLAHKMNGAIWDGIQRATDRGWMLQDRRSVCLTDAGRELVESWWTQSHSRKSPEAGAGSMPLSHAQTPRTANGPPYSRPPTAAG
jgi:hypothetical protein